MMKLISTATLSCLFLTACGSGSSTTNNQNSTIYGSKEGGYQFTVVSQNGYHAVRLNDQEWTEVNGELNLSNMSDTDTIEIVQLCEENEHNSYNSAKSEIHNLESLKYRINNEDRLIEYCYSTSQPDMTHEIEGEYSYFTLFSQQESEGIEINDVNLSNSYSINYDNYPNLQYGVILSELDNELLSIYVTAFNPELDEYYLYYDDSFIFSDGDMINLDFYSENSYPANYTILEESDYNYYLDYCYQDSYGNCFDLSINDPVEVRLELPIELQKENGVYNERWHLFPENGGRFYYSIESLEYNNENLIDKNINALNNLDITTSDEDIIFKNFSLNGFQPSEWYLSSETKYENFRLRSYNYVDVNEIKFRYVNLEDIPNSPSTFRQSNEEIESAEINLYAGIYDFEESSPIKSQYMNLTISIPLEYIQ